MNWRNLILMLIVGSALGGIMACLFGVPGWITGAVVGLVWPFYRPLFK